MPAERPHITPHVSPAKAATDVGDEVVALCPPTAFPRRAAKLSDCPRSLHVLWLEYELGFNGKKVTKTLRRRRGGQISTNITGGMCFGIEFVRWLGRGLLLSAHVIKFTLLVGSNCQ